MQRARSRRNPVQLGGVTEFRGIRQVKSPHLGRLHVFSPYTGFLLASPETGPNRERQSQVRESTVAGLVPFRTESVVK